MGMMLALISMTPQASAQLSTWPGSHQKNGVLTESTGYAPIYDRTLSGDYIGPLSPEWRNSPAIRDMIASPVAAFLVGFIPTTKKPPSWASATPCSACFSRSLNFSSEKSV
jgi:hypothetical protein